MVNKYLLWDLIRYLENGKKINHCKCNGIKVMFGRQL